MAQEIAAETSAKEEDFGLFARIVNKFSLLFAFAIVLAMLVLVSEVVMRYVFNQPTIWGHETSIFLCGIAFIYGGLFCVSNDRHIRVVLIYDMVPPKVKRVLNIAISVVSFLACSLFSWAAWMMVSRAIFAPDGSVRFETSGSAWDPIFPALIKLFLLIILIAMSVQFLLLTIRYARVKP